MGTFVKFYAPWCGHCKAMAKDWEQLAQKQEDVKIAEMDCTQESVKEICHGENADAFPTIFLYKDGKKLGDEFTGRRNVLELAEFLHESLKLYEENKTEEGTENKDQIKDIQQGPDPVAVPATAEGFANKVDDQ